MENGFRQSPAYNKKSYAQGGPYIVSMKMHLTKNPSGDLPAVERIKTKMKCRYTFPLKGRLIRFPIYGFTFCVEGRAYEFKETNTSQFELSVTVSDFPDTCLPSITKINDGKIKASISVPTNPFWDDLVSDIRTIEWALCIWGIDEIDTDECKTEWLPETDEEKQKLQLSSFSKKRDNSLPESLPYSPIDMFVRTILALPDLRESETPLNFYRRGKHDIYEERYIEAIYDLYFMLEFMFADGKFKKYDVIEKFLNSKELLESIEKVQQTTDPQIASNSALLNEFTQKYQSKSQKEIIEHIVQLRGDLHHYNAKKLNIWHPSKQRDFKVDALTILQICHEIISNRTIAVLLDKRHMEVFLETEVKTK